MNTFCPFFKETCRGNECVMFRNEECLIVSFMQNISEGIPSEEIIERSGIEFHRVEAEVPDWIKTRTPEELATEMLEFKKRKFPEYEKGLGFYNITEFFWNSKGIDSHLMPSGIRLKIERVNMLARNEIRKEAETQERERLVKEKEELPSLVSQCIDWARTNGLKRLTLADIDAYIMERNLDILKETRRALYAMANVKLKSKK